MLSAASMNAQVTIGSLDDPHPSALLDLKSTTQGLLLPQVELSNSTDFLTAGGDKTLAKGMLVYNTGNNLEGPGLYFWTGSMWKSISATCALPATPGVITFSPALTNDIVQNTLLTASVGLAAGATSYTWSVPEGMEIVGDATGRSVSIRATVIDAYDASTITVQATNDCGLSASRAGVGTVNVVGCSEAPAVPTLTVPPVKMNVGGTFTLRCSDVGATEYNWTLPEGLTAPSTTTTADSIVVTGTVEGIYLADTFKVSATTNGCGTSEEGTGVSGVIVVEQCSNEAPSDLFVLELSGVRVIGSRFTISLWVISKGTTVYDWSLPAGLTVVSGAGTMTVTVECTAIGTYSGSDIQVKVTNDCGNLTVTGSGTVKVVGRGTQGPDLAGANGTYTTFRYPMNLGTLMTTNSKEGTPSSKKHSTHEEGERGYYYNATDAPSACPDGWTLPTLQQLRGLQSYFSAISSVTAENEPWVSPDVLAGRVTNMTTGAGTYWDERLWIRGAGSTNSLFTTPATNTWTALTTGNAAHGYSVRCIKATCDEAPTVTSLFNLSRIIPKNVPVKIYVNARSIGNTSYQWSVPSGATFVEGVTSDTIYVTFASGSNFSGEQLSVKVSNDCGSTSMHYTGNYSLTADIGTSGPSITPTSYTYNTYIFPENLGTWMSDWSREGSPEVTAYEDKTAGERGYYYSLPEKYSACPSGWHLPTISEISNLIKFLQCLPVENEIRNRWLSSNSMPGNRSSVRGWEHWDDAFVLHAETGWVQYFLTDTFSVGGEALLSSHYSVRCIKNEN
jgi:hypothetical protein